MSLPRGAKALTVAQRLGEKGERESGSVTFSPRPGELLGELLLLGGEMWS